MAPAATNGNNESVAAVIDELPKWLENISLNKAVCASLAEQIKEISTINIDVNNDNAENSAALMLQIEAEANLKDDGSSTKSAYFILKTLADSNEAMRNVLGMLKLFPKEETMYHTILPKFEELYREAGKSITFAPKAHKFDRDLGVDYVLLEDVRSKGNYKNANRFNGLDKEHMECVLTKLAEFHAASACYVEHFGAFGEEFTIGVYSEKNRSLLKQFNASQAFLSQLKKWKNCQQYYDKLANSDDYLVDRLLEDQKYNPREFNVLNHGDCWMNNIMFQYDAFGKIKNTMFVDFQVCKYGSPANDLYYLILSSAAMNTKLTHFDYFIRFYYDRLIENLQLLQYHRPLPKLRNLHAALIKNGLAAYMVVSKVLPVVMFDKSDPNNIQNCTRDESKMKTAMYSNHKYIQAMSEIMPWLDNRGLLDWK